MTTKFRKPLALLLAVMMTVTMVMTAPIVSAASYDGVTAAAEDPENFWTEDGHYEYFYHQLKDRNPDAMRFYDALRAMYNQEIFKTGNGSYDLVENEVVTQTQLAAYANGDNTLLNNYGAARDAFFADYPEVFYVNTDNLTITVKYNAQTGYKASLGAGRTDNYYRKGFDSVQSVNTAIAALDESIESYVNTANEAAKVADPTAPPAAEATEAPAPSAGVYDLDDLRPGTSDEEKYREKTAEEKMITAVHDKLVRSTVYKLDSTIPGPKACQPENIENVRTAYGPLVAGESLCEGYSRGFKCIMDKLGIPCVLVQGVYKHGDGDEELHMWNMVRIREGENNVWYAVDSTFDDPSAWNGEQIDAKDSGHESTEYLLVGADIMDKQHVASGEMSECQFAFSYPALEMSGVSYDTVFSLNGLDVQYTENSNLYFGTDMPAPAFKVSYNGKGYERAALEDGVYILVKQYSEDTSSVEGGLVGNTEWVYADMALYNSAGDRFETDNYTLFPAWTTYYAEFAITKVPPKGHWYHGQRVPANPEIPNPSPDIKDNYGLDRLDYQYYKGDPAGFEAETGLLYNPAKKYLAPPYIKRGTPSQSGRVLIQGNMEIDCEYSFDQPLEQFAPTVTAADGEAEGEVVTPNGTPIDLKYGEDYGVYVFDKTENNASLGNIKVEEAVPSIHFDGDRTVTFKFKPDPTWASDCVQYLIIFKTMRGVVSKKIPNEISMVTSFPCAVCAYRSRGYFWNVHAKPQLISDSDIDIEGWTDSRGDPVDPGLSHRLSLVVTDTTQGEQNAMNELLEEKGVTPKASSMYNINLTVCKAMVPQPGQSVRVMMGFPEPYGPDDAGVKFTAYHYKQDERGNTIGVEEIPCEVTPYGLVILCSSFSPFAVVVTDKTEAEKEADKKVKTFVVTNNNGGTVTYSNTDEDGVMKITEEKPDQTFTVTPEQGYVIEQISIGSDVKYSNPDGTKSGAETVKVNFNDYKDLTAAAMVSVKFAPQAVLEKEAEENKKSGDTTVVQVVPNEVPESVPTETPTTEPTEAPATEPPATPTTAPTTAPTSGPAGPAIVKAYLDHKGNTVAVLSNIDSGVAVAAKYDGGALVAEKHEDINGNTVIFSGIEADKIMVWKSLDSVEPICEAKDVSPVAPDINGADINFTELGFVPVYDEESGFGFVSTSGAIMPEGYDRVVAGTDKITAGADGASVTESDGDYLSSKYKDSSSYTNYGGLIYRFDTDPGAYHVEVTLGGSSTSANTKIAPTGMDASRLTGTAAWDTAGHVARTASASWNENTWSYDFATGDSFVELDIEPTTLPTTEKPQTVTVQSIKITPIAAQAAGDKPTIHILGDSTQKTYTFNETISSWGQTLYKYFDLSKVNVVNYSMGGRCMRNNYTEGRFDDVLINGKAGDYVFLHSAHNDESPAETRFDRGCQYKDGDKTKANALYNRWLDMYVSAIKARGMIPVLVSPMPRSAGGATTFNPDSPANMKAKAASDPEVAYVELYQGAVDYYSKLDKNEGTWTYNSVEAGETPANNSANGANGDGTHYREAAAKQFCRIILQSIYDQSVAADDKYTDKAIMEKLVSYMPETVKAAAASENHDWSAVLPEQASDVDAVDVVPGATKQARENYYYRTSIEKALQIGALHKDSDNNFKPTQTITVGEFARGMEKVFGLEENSLTNYTKTYAELQAEAASADAAEYVPVVSGPADYAPGEAQAAAGQHTITVKQVEGGEITVYNNSAFKTATGDVPSGVKANEVFADNDYMTMTAPNELKAGNDGSGKFDNSEISTNYFEFRNASPEKIVKYHSKADGKITVYARFNDNKAIELTDGTDTQSQTLPGNGTGDTVYGTVQFNVKADTDYQLWARGGTGRLFGVKYESTNYPQSKESMVVNDGDEIRVVAIAKDGYLNDKITLNGKPVSSGTGREAIFEADADCEVSAIYKSEPAFVDTTIIASDAALTREAMGAILHDAYLAAYGKDENGAWNKVPYMNQNGGVPSPDDPNYDPNIKYEGSPYIPLVGWAALQDIGSITPSLYGKVKEAYNLGLMRSEKDLTRGQIKVGDELEPQAEVTRAKAAKALVFCFILTQEPNEESQIIPDNHNYAAETVGDIIAPNPDAPSTPYTK